MKNTRPILFIVLGVIAVGVAFFLALRQPQQSGQAPKRQFVTVPPPPSTYNFPPIPTGARFTFTGTRAAPETLRAYAVRQNTAQPFLESTANALSTQLGFTSAPDIAVIKDSYVFLRNQDPKYFSFTKTKETVAFTYEVSKPLEPGPSNMAPQDAALQFLRSLNYMPGFFSLVYLGIDDHAVEGVAVLDDPIPPLTKNLFGIRVNDVPVLTTEYAMAWALVVTDDRNRPRMATAVLPFAEMTPLSDVRLISPDVAAENLTNGNGALLGVTNADGDHFGEAPAFTTGTLVDFTLVYAPANNALVPAYLFTGVGTTASGTKQPFEALVLASSGRE